LHAGSNFAQIAPIMVVWEMITVTTLNGPWWLWLYFSLIVWHDIDVISDCLVFANMQRVKIQNIKHNKTVSDNEMKGKNGNDKSSLIQSDEFVICE
jgi:hypothetical protein